MKAPPPSTNVNYLGAYYSSILIFDLTQEHTRHDEELVRDEAEQVQLVEAHESSADGAAEQADDDQHEVCQPLQLTPPRSRRSPRVGVTLGLLVLSLIHI